MPKLVKLFGQRSIWLWTAVFLISGSSIACAKELINYSHQKRYHVRQIACSYNKNITTMDILELNVSMPESWPDCKISNIGVSGNNPFLLHNTEGPGQIYRTIFKNHLPKKGETVWVSVDYDVLLYQVDINLAALSEKAYPEYKKDAEHEYYMRLDSPLVPDDPEVKPIIDECKRKANGNPVLYAKAVFDWIGQNIKYGPQPEGGPKAWLKERKGDCGAIAHIFVYLCRDGGVPARFIAGCWAGCFDGWHCWAEFYVPEVGWIPIDHSPAGGFGHITNNHLPLVKAGDMKFDVKPDQGGNSVGFVQFGYWFYGFGGGEGGSIDTEFTVESFPYTDMPPMYSKQKLQDAHLKANNYFDRKDYSRALQIYRCLLLSEFSGEKDKDLLHYQLAKCYLKKKQPVRAALELLPLIENQPDSDPVKKLLEEVRKEEVFVSVLNIERIRQGWGCPQRDKSVEGKPISIAGRKFDRGIGTHADSYCVIETNNSVKEFSSYVGIDDEIIKGNGSVEFFVIGDDKILWQSGIMKSGDTAKAVKVKTKGVKTLVLKVGYGGDSGDSDHADWADAKLLVTGVYPTIVTP